MRDYIIFNGVSTKDLFVTSSLEIPFLAKEVKTVSSEHSDGSRFLSTRLTENSLSAEIVMGEEFLKEKNIKSVYDIKRTMANFFDTSEPVKLVWSADPNVYYKAIYSETANLEFINKDVAKATIKFIVPDGLAHSEVVTYTSETNVYNIDYTGTYKSPLNIRVTVGGDNGAISVVNGENKVIQFGDTKEDDTFTDDSLSKLVINDIFDTGHMANWKVNKSTTPIKSFVLGATFNVTGTANNWVYTVDRTDLVPRKGSKMTLLEPSTTYKAPVKNQWNGITFERDITPTGDVDPETAKNFNFFFVPWYWTGAIKQTGIFALELILDTEQYADPIFLRVSLDKRNVASNKGTIRMSLISPITGKLEEVVAHQFDTTVYSYVAKFKQILVRKVNSQIELHAFDKIWVFRDNFYTDYRIKTVKGYLGKWSTTEQMRTSIQRITTQKHNVENIIDVSNTFMEGDIVDIDVANKSVQLNGMDATELADIGNEWDGFYLENGKNEFTFVPSSWADNSILTTEITAEDLYK